MEKFPHGYNHIEDDAEDYPQPQLTPEKKETQKEKMMRMMGLYIPEKFTEEEMKKYLVSDARINAYRSIQSETMPPAARSEQKRGIVSEMLRRGYFTEELLKKNSAVYFGSGFDLEYPLSLGFRNITLYDPVFQHAEAKEELSKKFSKYAVKTGALDGVMDFGEGEEKISVSIIDKLYDSEHPYTGPDSMGAAFFFASHGAEHTFKNDQVTQDKIVDGGGVLDLSQFTQYKNGEKKEINLWEK